MSHDFDKIAETDEKLCEWLDLNSSFSIKSSCLVQVFLYNFGSNETSKFLFNYSSLDLLFYLFIYFFSNF